MERPLFKPVGTPVLQLDTPALVVDLAVLEQNIDTVHTVFRQRQARLRPHVSAHRCPIIAHAQLAAGGTVGGIGVTTLGEAEVFNAHGFRDIFVANEIVTSSKLRRLCALAQRATITVAVDHVQNVAALAAAATAHGSTLRVVVDILTGTGRSGVAPGRPALELARAVCQAVPLEFAGLMSTAAPIRTADPAEATAAIQQGLQPVLDTRNMLEQAGIPVQVVSVGGTVAYETVVTMAGVTEVRAGTYALMDAGHAPLLPHLRPAAHVLTTVTSRPEPSIAITDVGQKAVGIDLGLPLAANIPGATVLGLSAEHCRLRLEGTAMQQIEPGEKLWLTPWDIGTCTNLYDYMHAVRHGTLEAVWSVAARGQYR
jgi:D-serine deaminase-like pyridoxal phosphate-dependent protein